MNKIASVGLIAGMIVGLVGCGAKSPEEVVKQTLDVLRSGKASESSLAETCTSDTSMFLANLGKDLADGLNGFDVRLAYIDDDVAAVRLKSNDITFCYFLKKIDGQWKVNVYREDVLGEVEAGKDRLSNRAGENMIRALKCAFINTDDAELKKYFTDGLIAECKLNICRNGSKDEMESRLKDMKVVQSKVKVEDSITTDVRITADEGKLDVTLKLKFGDTGWKALYMYVSGKEFDEKMARENQKHALEVVAGGERAIRKEVLRQTYGFSMRSLFVAIDQANVERDSVGLPTVWPRTKDFGNDKDDIAGKSFKSASDYFAALFDLNNFGKENWKPYVDNECYNIGSNLKVFNLSEHARPFSSDWIVAANVKEEFSNYLPVLISANVDPKSIKVPFDRRKEVIPVGSRVGRTGIPWGNDYVLVVNKLGMVNVIEAEKFSNYTLTMGMDVNDAKGLQGLEYLDAR